jgi:hypothetical protein
MNLKHIILPSAALAGAATLLLPNLSEAFSVIGGNLGPTQRDVRLFNNFGNAGANGNTTPDSNFPGYDGAEMAIWKSVVEWGSTLHGTGNGDPHQPAGLGSGGANFDAFWAGNATGIGTTNNNVMSEGGGCGSGVLAYTETPISDGWRIIFCDSWTWDDGPGTTVSGIDIQGVSCHEYGHALGLGHSAVNGATMFPSISGSGVSARSIAADDIAGVQSVYGVASVTKPRITGVSVSLGQVTITGQNFGATGNTVWFTSGVPTSTAVDPLVTVANVNSNGTLITVSPPANAGSGDVIVKITGAANNTVSNAFPIDLTGAVCPAPTNFCVAAANSYSANGATIGFAGTTEISNNDLQLITQGIPPGKLTLHLYSQDQSVFLTFGNGFRCIGSPFFRIYPAANADMFGQVFYNVDLNALPPAGHISAGQSWGFMAWYRDPAAGGAFFNGSDALSTTWCP